MLALCVSGVVVLLFLYSYAKEADNPKDPIDDSYDHEQLYREAVEHFQEKRYTDAIDLFNRFASAPEFVKSSRQTQCDTLRSLANLLAQEHNREQAILAFRQAIAKCRKKYQPTLLHNYAATILQHAVSTEVA